MMQNSWDSRKVIAEKRDKIIEMQDLNQGDPSETIRELQSEVIDILEDEDLKWCQRVKQRWWLKDGDRNTKFYHSCINQRKKSNSILSISSDEGLHASQPKEVSELFESFTWASLPPLSLKGSKTVYLTWVELLLLR